MEVVLDARKHALLMPMKLAFRGPQGTKRSTSPHFSGAKLLKA